jgi:hypothetical protein
MTGCSARRMRGFDKEPTSERLTASADQVWRLLAGRGQGLGCRPQVAISSIERRLFRWPPLKAQSGQLHVVVEPVPNDRELLWTHVGVYPLPSSPPKEQHDDVLRSWYGGLGDCLDDRR